MSVEGHPALVPGNAHDELLASRVHPADWANPEPAARYHLVVLGAGTAGLISAIVAAGAGARVALVERDLMGGDCLNVGCVPSKGVIAAARAWTSARRVAEVFGGPRVDAGSSDFARAMDRMRGIRAGIARHDSAARFRDLGIDVFLGQGTFVAADAVEVDGSRLRFRRAVVATGARAALPPIPGLDEVDPLTNESVFSLTELPARLAVIGGGPIGCELAQAFARFGAEVDLLDTGERILRRQDADAARIVEEHLERDGVRLHLGVAVESAVPAADGAGRLVVERGGDRSEVAFDRLLVAAGRRPAVEGLGLEAAGVRFGREGVEVDARLRTSNPRIFACGDVATRLRFTHTADAEAKIVVQNALFFRRLKATDLVVPWTIYTSPEVAHVGHSPESAREAGHEIESLTVPLADNDRARLEGEDAGFLRLHLKKGSGRILGGTLVGTDAGDLLAPLALAVTHRISLSRFASTIFPYPTRAEIYKRAASEWQKGKLTPLVRRVLGWWMNVFR